MSDRACDREAAARRLAGAARKRARPIRGFFAAAAGPVTRPSAGEQAALAERMRSADPDEARAARDELVLRNYPLLLAVVSREAKNLGGDVEEMLGDALEYALRITRRFDPARAKYQTFLVTPLRRELRRRHDARRAAVRVSRGAAETARLEAAGLPSRRARLPSARAAEAARAALGGGRAPPGAADGPGREADPARAAEDADSLAAALAALAGLSARERLLVEMRFGMGGRRPALLREIGEALGCSHEHARALLRAAVSRLREATGLGPD